MSAKLTLHCDGCEETHKVGDLRKIFTSFDGSGYGFGVRVQPDIDKLVELSGWVWSDPYTSCCY